MKKLLQWATILLVLLSVGTVRASAQTPEPPLGEEAEPVSQPYEATAEETYGDSFDAAVLPSSSWSLQRIDDRHSFYNNDLSQPQPGKHNLKYDSNGTPHIVYGGDHLYHAVRTSLGWWLVEVVDPAFDVGSYASLAIDNENKLHIAYYDEANKDLKYATNAFGYWYIVTVVSAGNVGAGTDIAVDQYQDPYFVYRDVTNSHLMFAYLEQGNMVEAPENISGNLSPAGSFSMAMFSPLDVHAIFNVVSGNKGGLYFTSTKTAQRWAPSWIYSAGYRNGAVADIALDSAGNSHVVFSFNDENGYLDDMSRYFVSNNFGASWQTPYDDFVDLGTPTGLALRLTNGNIPHIAMQMNGNLYHYYWTGQVWQPVLVDDSTDNTGYYPAIAISPGGEIGFSYLDDPAGTAVHLNYRGWTGSAWQPVSGPIKIDRSEKVGGCSTTLADSAGNPWVIYSGDTARTLYVKQYLNGAWIACGVAFRKIQFGEVVIVGLDVGAFGDRKTHVGENSRQFIGHLADRMYTATFRRCFPHRQRHIDGFGVKPCIKCCGGELVFCREDRRGDAVLQSIDGRALSPALFRRHRTKRLEQCRDRTTLSEG
jgi:hypothetical protein